MGALLALAIGSLAAAGVAFAGVSRSTRRDIDSWSERPVVRRVLGNGLTVVLVPDHKTPLVGMELTYRVGTRTEPDTPLGIAGLIVRLMMRATAHLAEGDYDRYLDAAGGVDATWSVGFDWTMLRVTVPSDQIALPLWLWSDQMGFLAQRLDDRLIAQQLTVLENERIQKRDNVPAGNVPNLLTAQLYPASHPYHTGLFPSLAGLRGLGVRQIQAFIAAHYAPDHAILTLVGDFDVQRAESLVQTYFGSLAASGVKPAPAPARGQSPDSEIRLAVDARVDFPSVTIGWRTAPLFEPGDAELDLIAEWLVGQRAGWLRGTLIDQLKIASHVGAHQFSHELASEFYINATATAGHTAAELVVAIDGVLRAMQNAAPPPFEFHGSTAGFLTNRLFSLEQNGKRAYLHSTCELMGVREGCIASWFDRYKVPEAAQLSRIAAQELPLGRRVVIEVTPAQNAPVAGELRGHQAVPR